MSDFATQFQTGPQDQLEDLFGEAITSYARTGQSSITTMTGRFVEEEVEVVDQAGVYTRAPALTFVVLASAINFGSGAVDPERADLITRSDGRVFYVAHKGTYVTNSAEWRIPLEERTP